jgi:hypothetical protein
MGLEIRNGRTYFYRKIREGTKVRSVYEGGGFIASLHARRADEEKFRKEIERKTLEAELTELEVMVENALRTGKTALTALYLANGYHTHSRSWRRKRT